MHKRIRALALCFIFAFSVLASRCGYIALSKNYAVSESYNSYKITIGELYTNIYDRGGRLLNNNSYERIAIIPPSEKAIGELGKLFSAQETAEIHNELSSGYPVKRVVRDNVNTNHILQYYRTVDNPDTMLAKHILCREYGGIEQFTSKKIGELSVNFGKYASGSLLTGDNVKVINDNYNSKEGIFVSINSDIQKIAEAASKSIPKGAVVILDTDTSEVLASVSCGNDYVNRAISSFCIGSIFKIVVCACAIENNIDLTYECKSKIIVGDTTFNCQKGKAHGIQNMNTALANSCNCYFVKLALKLGADKLCNTAISLGFGGNYNLYDDWKIKSGQFPDIRLLNEFSGQLALSGFGQGQITDSPLHFASVIACIANGGTYLPPTLNLSDKNGKQILSSKSCKRLRGLMRDVVEYGTGVSADFDGNTAGKTATAQSGIYVDGREILNTWFAGFYPYDKPKYSIVILQEDGTSGAENCCPVFRTIVEKLEKL